MQRGLSRRDFLKLTSAGAVALAVPWSLEACGGGEKPLRFFTDQEHATLEAAAARLFPADADAGALELQTVRYIDRMLSAFDRDPPLVFAGGPFSGRQPEPDNQAGKASDHFPKAQFERFLPLSRTQEIAWRVRVYGSANVEGGDFNDAVLEPISGWRDVYRTGIAALDAKSQALFTKDFVDVTPEQQDEVLADKDAVPTSSRLLEHTIEGAYAAPEYGGNADLAGWAAVKFEGDSQPLGYSIYDESTETSNEIPEHPLSTENPNEEPGFSPEALQLINNIVTLVGGQQFF